MQHDETTPEPQHHQQDQLQQEHEHEYELECQRKRHRRRKTLSILAAIFCVLAIGVIFLRRTAPPKPEAGTAAQKAVPVSTEEGRKGDIGDFIQALGTVTPVYTATIFSRVQGELTSVNYKEGQNVKKGDSLVEIDSRPFEAAVLQYEGQLAHDRGVLQQAKIDLDRYRKAWKKNAIPKQQLDDQEQLVIQTEGSVKSDEGLLNAALANLSYTHIKAPIDGRVGLRLIDPGNMVQANSTTALVVVAQIRPITVIFNVSQDFLPQIQEQLKKGETMEVDAYDRSQEKKIATGKFLSLDNIVDTTTGTVKIRAVFPNENDELFPNQFVNAKLLLYTKKGATLLSSNAVQLGAHGTFVYVIRSNNTAELRPVKVGIVNGGVTEVEGIQAGEAVAVNGFDKLQDGAKVSVVHGQAAAGIKAPLPSPSPSVSPKPSPSPQPSPPRKTP